MTTMARKKDDSSIDPEREKEKKRKGREHINLRKGRKGRKESVTTNPHISQERVSKCTSTSTVVM